MLNVNAIIEKLANRKGVSVTRELRSQIKLRLAHAGFEEAQESDETTVVALVKTVLKRIAPAPTQKRTAGVLKTAACGGSCPRCRGPLSVVHLADNTPSNYCGTCRISQVG